MSQSDAPLPMRCRLIRLPASDPARLRTEVLLRSILRAASLSPLAFIAGCALILNGSEQAITIDSSPPGARVRVDPGNKILTTPGSVLVSRKYPATVVVEKDGYEPTSVTFTRRKSLSLWRNLVWIHPIGWIIGISVDVGKGACYDLEPSQVHVDLKPLQTAPAPTDAPSR